MACGIIGITGRRGVFDKALGKIIKESLKRLEYRGYDSVGFAIVTMEGELVIRKSKGMIDNVSVKLGFDDLDGFIGIGHTRWATHGIPNDINSHPHIDCTGRIAVAHNGIIENYIELREELMKKGHTFLSDTDTETVPHLIEEFKKKGLSPYDAFKKAVSMLTGAYAIVAIDLDAPGKIFFVRKTSPLVLGLGDGVNFVASDIPAFLDYTNKVIVLRDNELGYVDPNNIIIEELVQRTHSLEDLEVRTNRVNWVKRVRVVDWSPEMAKKGGYPHFMLKEIHEQPQSIASTLAGLADDIRRVSKILSSKKRIIFIGAGTSYHASLLGALITSYLAGIWTHAIISSEGPWYLRNVSEDDAIIAVSQSGETIDTLMAVREAKKNGALVIALSNILDSAIPRESDDVIYTRAGPEIGVAATKTFTTQVASLTWLAIELARQRNAIDSKYADDLLRSLKAVPEYVRYVIAIHEARCRRIARFMATKDSAFYLGRGLALPVTMEGALKLKEVAYVHAEAYPAGESKHGPIALVDEGFPVVFTILGSYDSKLISSNIQEMKARRAWTIAIVPKNENSLINMVDEAFKMPNIDPIIAPIIYVIPLQLIAYYTAVSKGYNPDKPRNLAKTVTVV